MRLTERRQRRSCWRAAETWWSGDGDPIASCARAGRRSRALYREHGALLRAIVEVSTYDEEVARFWRGLRRAVRRRDARADRGRAGGGAARCRRRAHADGVRARLDDRARVLPAARPGRAGRARRARRRAGGTIFERSVYGASSARRAMRVWVDLTNTAHVVVLRPLVERLEAAGHEVAITARPLSHTVELLDDWGHPYTAIGALRRARRGRQGARGARPRAGRWSRFGREHGPFDAALAHGVDRPAGRLPRCCGSRTRRCSTTSSRSRSTTSTAGSPNRVLVPEAIPPERLAALRRDAGAKLVRYPGLKEEYVLHGFEPDPAVLDALGVDRARPLAVVRTAPSYALYLGGAETAAAAAAAAPARRRRACRPSCSSATPSSASEVARARASSA